MQIPSLLSLIHAQLKALSPPQLCHLEAGPSYVVNQSMHLINDDPLNQTLYLNLILLRQEIKSTLYTEPKLPSPILLELEKPWVAFLSSLYENT